jgi:uncharacterized tellurite resistance protein B-like protein
MHRRAAPLVYIGLQHRLGLVAQRHVQQGLELRQIGGRLGEQRVSGLRDPRSLGRLQGRSRHPLLLFEARPLGAQGLGGRLLLGSDLPSRNCIGIVLYAASHTTENHCIPQRSADAQGPALPCAGARYPLQNRRMREHVMVRSTGELLNEVSDAERTALATLLVLDELARSDANFDQREATVIALVIKTTFKLDPERVAALMLLVDDARGGPADLVGLSNTIKARVLSIGDRERIAMGFWQVVVADGTITSLEDRLVNSITTLLGISFRRIAEIRADIESTG